MAKKLRKCPAITHVYTRFYSDNEQLTAYVEWSDGSRTEGAAVAPLQPQGEHMNALFARAARHNIQPNHEVW